MSWRCDLCETYNKDDTVICEVCNAISPFLAWFKYDYESDNKSIVSWNAENFSKIEILYNDKSHLVTNLKTARVRLNKPVSFIVFKLTNDPAERIYTFSIPSNKK